MPLPPVMRRQQRYNTVAASEDAAAAAATTAASAKVDDADDATPNTSLSEIYVFAFTNLECDMLLRVGQHIFESDDQDHESE